jgi:hypothetical protein
VGLVLVQEDRVLVLALVVKDQGQAVKDPSYLECSVCQTSACQEGQTSA